MSLTVHVQPYILFPLLILTCIFIIVAPAAVRTVRTMSTPTVLF